MKDTAHPSEDGPRPRGGTPTLHQLRIFDAVAQAETLTCAAKDLGLTQPSLSLQLGKLESTLGTRLFHRRPGEMELTAAGQFLLPQVRDMLRTLREAEEGLEPFRQGYQPVLRIAGVDSALRSVLPPAVSRLQAQFPDVSFEIRESAPAEVLEQLHARRIHLGLVAAGSLEAGASEFQQVPVLEDDFALFVPDWLDLDHVADPDTDLTPSQRAVLRRSIHFVFGSPRANRVSGWYDRLLPGHRPAASCRSFETALSLVRAGSGVCIAPSLSASFTAGAPDGLRRYRLDVSPRRIVAVLPAQRSRAEPVATLLAELAAAGQTSPSPSLRPTPPFLRNRHLGTPD